MKKKVAILKGGSSSERAVSLSTGDACSEAISKLGYNVKSIDTKYAFIEDLIKFKPDIVFNALHGRHGEDGIIQGVLETMKIPYTHSGVLASSIAMDKNLAKVSATKLIGEGVTAIIGAACPDLTMEIAKNILIPKTTNEIKDNFKSLIQIKEISNINEAMNYVLKKQIN